MEISSVTSETRRRKKNEERKKEKSTAVKYKPFGIAMPDGLRTARHAMRFLVEILWPPVSRNRTSVRNNEVGQIGNKSCGYSERVVSSTGCNSHWDAVCHWIKRRADAQHRRRMRDAIGFWIREILSATCLWPWRGLRLSSIEVGHVMYARYNYSLRRNSINSH